MKKVIFYGMVILALVACGGGSSGSGTIDPADINLAKDIEDGEIQNYDSTDSIEDQYLTIINYLRSLAIKCNDSAGFTGPSGNDMQWNTSLADAAEEHSRDMSQSVYYGHDGSGTSNDTTGQTFIPARPSKFYERIARNSFTGSPTAENIAMSSANYVLPSNYWITVMEGWIKSTHGHCSNIMNPQLTEFGMFESRADADANGTYKTYWTQDFGGN